MYFSVIVSVHKYIEKKQTEYGSKVKLIKMADGDFMKYESEDDTALNDAYDNLGSEVESSDGFPTEPEKVNTCHFLLNVKLFFHISNTLFFLLEPSL